MNDFDSEIPDGEEFPTVTKTDDWLNYGDANPEIHGGRFVKWDSDGGYWKVVETLPWGDILPEKEEEDGHMVQINWIYPEDLFVDEEPEKGPTEAFKSVLDSLSIGYLEALTDYRIEYFVADIPDHVRLDPRDDTIPEGEYWEYLSEFGITEEDA